MKARKSHDITNQDIASLWDRVPEKWQNRSQAVLRHLLVEYRAKWIRTCFRARAAGLTQPENPERHVPERMPPQPPGPTSPEKQERFRQVAGLSYIIDGRIELRFEKQGWKTAGPGDLLIASNGQDRILETRHLGNLREISVHVDGLTATTLREEKLWDLEPGIIRIGAQPNLLKRFVELQRDLEDYGISSGSLLRRFVAMIDEVAALTRIHSPEERFRSVACSELAARTAEDRAVEEVAAVLGLSVRQFRRRFQAANGISPRDYLVQVRMEQANHLLTFCSVKETANRLGYNDPFGFSRQYKKMFGMSPGRARAKEYPDTRPLL